MQERREQEVGEKCKTLLWHSSSKTRTQNVINLYLAASETSLILLSGFLRL